MYLYANELYIEKKKIELNYEDEDFILVNGKFFNYLCLKNNYKELKAYFKGKINNFEIDDKVKQDIINNFSEKDLKFLDENNNSKVNKDLLYNEINIKPIINPNDSTEVFLIFQDFLLIQKKCAEVLLNDYNLNSFYSLKCTFAKKNLIIFHYPMDKYEKILNNRNDICVISTIDENNCFKNEYILKYDKKGNYMYHIKLINKNIRSYLEGNYFINNVAPIVQNGYIEIGTIIKINNDSASTLKNIVKNDNIICNSSINNLKNNNQSEIQNKNINNNYLKINNGEIIFSVNFLSMGIDEIKNYSLACKNTDLFSQLEERFYNDFPQFRNKLFFTCNARQIDRNKTLDENKIKGNDIINVFEIQI